jgi:hypothetical protein
MAPPTKWSCTNATGPLSCPPVVPNDGTSCGAPGVTCGYGFPCGGAGTTVSCVGGAWKWQVGVCPA